MQTQKQSTTEVKFSIIIGLVSTEDNDRILETLDVLRGQEGGYSYEVILADRRHDDVSSKIREEYPEATLLPCPPGMSLPWLRTEALKRAAGSYIIVTEDHCVPSRNWLASIVNAFQAAPEDTVAVGGCVENGVSDTPLDWATFFCEYSFYLDPVAEGLTDNLPGMNVTYDRHVFDDIDQSILTSGFWETTLHPVLLQKDKKFYSTNKIKLFHCKKFSFKLFAKQRYIYSKYYAGLRFPRHETIKRVVATAATSILPPLLLYRMIKQVSAKKRLKAEFRSALPTLSVFIIIWAVGEMAGYLLGTGDALNRIE